MHILFLLAVPVLLSLSTLPLFTQILLQAVVLAFLIPDIFLAFRNSPPFIPTFGKDLRKMMALADIQKGDRMYDLGCGDGRLVFAAGAKGAKATGIEYAIPPYLYAKLRSFFHAGSTILFGDFWTRDYRDADVIFCYLLPETMQKFYAEIWPQLKKGTRVVSNSFKMKNLTPLRSEGGVHLYVK